MKIVEVRSFLMASPRRDYMFVKISTDEGIHGWGEGTLERKQRTVAAAVGDLTPFVMGEDPTRVDHLWQQGSGGVGIHVDPGARCASSGHLQSLSLRDYHKVRTTSRYAEKSQSAAKSAVFLTKPLTDSNNVI